MFIIRTERTLLSIKELEFWNPCEYFPRWVARIKILISNPAGVWTQTEGLL